MLAQYWKALEEGKVECGLCPHRCVVSVGRTGRCLARQNQEGALVSLNYGRISSMNIDPVEKKPLRHFMPGTRTLSFGTFGCNLHCPWCQNYTIAREIPDTQWVEPEEMVALAKEQGCPSISYTYNEPTVFLEYVLDTARLAREAGLKNIFVTNGFISPEPLEDLLAVMDALNIDVKTFDVSHYHNVCGGGLEDVKRTVERARQRVHVELTALLVPGIHDNLEDLESMFEWIASMDPDMPLHLSRYFPMYQYHEPATEPGLMIEAKKRADRVLHRVYLGNV